MDGNGRWARQRGLPRARGHHAGADNLRRVLRACADAGIEFVTLYAFSTENWRRATARNPHHHGPAGNRHRPRAGRAGGGRRANPPYRPPGRPLALPAGKGAHGHPPHPPQPPPHREPGFQLWRPRRNHPRHPARSSADRIPPEQIDESLIRRYLFTGDQPDPDLIIRTSGELRVSNFLIWQGALCRILCNRLLTGRILTRASWRARWKPIRCGVRRYGQTDEQREGTTNGRPPAEWPAARQWPRAKRATGRQARNAGRQPRSPCSPVTAPSAQRSPNSFISPARKSPPPCSCANALKKPILAEGPGDRRGARRNWRAPAPLPPACRSSACNVTKGWMRTAPSTSGNTPSKCSTRNCCATGSMPPSPIAIRWPPPPDRLAAEEEIFFSERFLLPRPLLRALRSPRAGGPAHR